MRINGFRSPLCRGSMANKLRTLALMPSSSAIRRKPNLFVFVSKKQRAK
jgi:hypothetical protein